MKRCNQCGTVKPLEDFHRDRRKRDGRGSECKPCARRRVRENTARRRAEMGEEAWLAKQAEARRAFRATPEGRTQGRLQGRAQNAALWRLVDLHREEFDALLTEERVARGLTAVRWERQPKPSP